MWTLLKTVVDWAKYQREAEYKVSASVIRWGNPPAAYPCLVSTIVPDRPMPGTEVRLVSAFVYPADAEELLASSAAIQQRAAVPAEAPAAKPGRDQAEFYKWLTAHVLTAAYFIVETGLGTHKKFEDKLTEMLALADQYHGEQRDEIRKTLPAYQATVLDTLDPPE